MIEREQRLPAPPQEVFPFFADAHNLEAITPPLLGFRVVTPRPIEMRAGTLIEYRLRLRGVPLSWLTRIEEWEPGERFVDRQLRGPYALWHHTHTFEPEPGGSGGTLMRDRVLYRPRWWGIPGLALVRRDLERIFDFRSARIASYFTL